MRDQLRKSTWGSELFFADTAPLFLFFVKMVRTIDIFSDVVCPWCYLGKANLERALAALPESQRPQIRLLPYELNPSTPVDGVNRREYLEAKYGNAIAGAERRLETMGREAGIEFRFDAAQIIPNTFQAHRLIFHASSHGREKEMVDALFYAYFTEGRDVGKVEVLKEIAAKVGLDPEAVQTMLSSEEGTEEVRLLEQQAREIGINGVPFFILDSRYGVSGAQTAEVFADILKKASDASREEAGKIPE